MLILQMLQEGKITPEEAHDLLEALALSEQASRDSGPDYWDDVKSRIERAGEMVEEQAEKFREKVEETIEEARARYEAARDKAASGGAPIEGVEDVVVTVERGLSQFAKEFPEAMRRLFSFTFGSFDARTVERVYEGAFGEGVQEAAVAVEARNGSVKWETWDQPGYKVIVTSKVRASDDAAARERVERFVHWQAADDGFRLSAADRSDISSSVTVLLPKTLRYKLESETRNGSIRAKGVRVTSGQLRTVNGGIRVEDVEAERLETVTVNGGVRLHGAVEDLRGETTNGSVEARLVGMRRDGGVVEQAHWELEATNGSIRVYVPHGPDIGYDVNLKTVTGRVKVELPGFVTVDGRGAGRDVSWRSEGMEDKPRRIGLTVGTVHGSIVVAAENEQDAADGADEE